MQDNVSFSEGIDMSTTTGNDTTAVLLVPSQQSAPSRLHRPNSSVFDNTLITHSKTENSFQSKQPPSKSCDRFIARAVSSRGERGGLAEACGFHVNRMMEYNKAPPMQRKYAASEFVGLYAKNNQNLRPTSKPSRKISAKPTRILDAPGIVDDFYGNIIDWSNAVDCMAIGLGSTVYGWSPHTSDASVIADLDTGTTNLPIVNSVKWSREDNCLAVANSKGEVQIWDAGSESIVRTMRGRPCERVAALSWNGPILSSGGRNGSIWNHDVRVKNHKVGELRCHNGEICGLQWRDDGRMLASGGNDNMVAIWDSRITSVPKNQINAHKAAVKALAWCPWQTNLLVTGGGCADRQIHFWNVATGVCANSLDAGSQVTSLHWNKNHRELAATLGYPYNSISVWSYPSLTNQVQINEAHESRILSAALSMDGQTLVTCAADENIKFWNLFEAEPKAKHQNGFRLGMGSFATAPSRV